MKTRDVPPEQWQASAGAFSRQHEGWLATLEVKKPPPESGPPDSGPRELLAEARPLRGFALVEDGKAPWWITVGQQPDEMVHRVRAPQRVTFDLADRGAHAGVTITTTAGETTRLRFRSPAKPEQLDGVPERTVPGELIDQPIRLGRTR